MDTIVAVSSPPVGCATGSAGGLPLAIVRLSGLNAAAYADIVFKIPRPEVPRQTNSTIPRSVKNTRKVDDSLVAALAEKKWRRIAGVVKWRGNELSSHAYLMPSPKSYTREDVVELHMPGIPWLLDEIIDALLAAGARAALPGEFTRRAFENGRISVEQAETVGKLIAASTADEARAYAGNLAAHGGKQRVNLKKDLEDLLAQVELGLDFAHEDVVVISLDELSRRLNELHARAVKLASDSSLESERAAVVGEPRIVLMGPTNAGKSLLFNSLLNRNAAIVSANRHTTRDAVEAQLHFKNGSSAALLIDSAGSGAAGSDDAAQEIFHAARSATLRALATADVLVVTLDRSISLHTQEGLPELAAQIARLNPAVRVLVWTKCDLPPATGWAADMATGFSVQERIEVSALTGKNIEILKAFLAESSMKLAARTVQAHAAAAASIRFAARSAAEALERATGALRDASGEDVVAVELREAIHAFWQAEGILMRHDAVTEAALDTLFAQFCIGK